MMDTDDLSVRFPEPTRSVVRAAVIDYARASGSHTGQPDTTATLADDLLEWGAGLDTQHAHLTVVDRAVPVHVVRGRDRRLRAAAVLVVAACLVAAAAVWASTGTSVQRTDSSPTGDGPAAATSAMTPAAGPLVPVTPQVVARTLQSLLPPGRVLSTAGGQVAGQSYTTTVFDDGSGAAQINMVLTAGTQTPCQLSTSGCTTRPDGSTVFVSRGLEYPQQHTGATEWNVVVTRDGLSLSLSEWNAPTSKDAAISRATPPLPIDQVTRLLDDGSWALQVPEQVARAAAPLFVPSGPTHS